MIKNMLGLLAIVGLVGCATIPKNAPQEFYEAQASLERLDKTKGEHHFPNTAARANASFTESLKMLKDSGRKEPKYTRDEAIQKASQAKSLADGVNTLSGKIGQWDTNETDLKNAVSTLDSTSVGNLAITLEPSPLDQEPAGPTAALSTLQGSEYIADLAFFGAGQSSTALYYLEDSLGALVGLLSKNPDLKVRLIGFADKRGKQAFNQRLAEERARTVAYKLRQWGVAESQISTEGRVADIEGGTQESKQAAAFSRRVQAKVKLP